MENITLKQLPSIAQDLLKKAKKAKSTTATVIALSGDLGSGKTTLTQELARQLGVKENVISPTFVIMKKYNVIDDTFKYLIHIDAYRLEKSEELLKLGWQNLLEDKNNLIIVEWPENVEGCIPDNACRVQLAHKDENIRTIKL
jgi:tRNA threonylcarbamoyladenosine biosynthesis protein TsaE